MDELLRLRQLLEGYNGRTIDGTKLHQRVLAQLLREHPPRNKGELKNQQRLLRLIEATEIDPEPGLISIVSEKSGYVSIAIGRAKTNRALTLIVDRDSTLKVSLSGDGLDDIDDEILDDAVEMVRNLFTLCFGDMVTYPPWIVAHIVDSSVGPNYNF